MKDWGDSKSDFLSFTRPDTAPPLHCPNLHVFEMRERAKLFSSIAMSHCDCDTSNQFMAVADLNRTPAQIVTVMKPSSANTCSSLSCEKCSITGHYCNLRVPCLQRHVRDSIGDQGFGRGAHTRPERLKTCLSACCSDKFFFKLSLRSGQNPGPKSCELV